MVGLDAIKAVLLEITPILHVTNIQQSTIDRLLTLLIKVDNEEQLQEFYLWLLTLRDGPVKEVRAIYELKPPEWWVNMGMFGIEHTREFRLLNAAKKQLRAAWRTRYGQKPKDITDGQEQGDSVSGSEDSDKLQIQPQQARADAGDRGDR